MNAAPVKVLYIAGSGRSGSTLLDNMLGQVEGFFSAGEINFLWERGLVENRLCGCGERFQDCPMWTRILEEAFGGVKAIDPVSIMQLQKRGIRARNIPAMLLSRRGRSWRTSPAEGYRETLGRLYLGIQSVTGCRVIVDSSKNPGYGFVLSTIPQIELYVVQLVRDPRGAAYSWMRKKQQPDTGYFGYMNRKGPVKSSLLWTVWNGTAEALWRWDPKRYVRMRYEDFVERPAESLRRILTFTGEEPGSLPFLRDGRVELRANHTVSGNPLRLQSGSIQLHADRQWVSELPKRDWALVTALTWPLLLRYRYSPWRRGVRRKDAADPSADRAQPPAGRAQPPPAVGS